MKKSWLLVLILVIVIGLIIFTKSFTGFAFVNPSKYDITCFHYKTTIEGPNKTQTDPFTKVSLALFNSKIKRYYQISEDVCVKRGSKSYVKEVYCVKKSWLQGRRDSIAYKPVKLCENGCANGVCMSKIVCSEEQKLGLCGPKENIFPLMNRVEGKTIRVFEPGLILENNNFKISLESPKFLLTNTKYQLNITIENTKQEKNLFQYYYWACNSSEEVCSDIYEEGYAINMNDAEFIREGKNEFWKSSFTPNEKKTIQVVFKPISPTLVETPMHYLMLIDLTEGFDNPYFLYFSPWIKPDENYGGNAEKTIPPSLTKCGNLIFPSVINPPRYLPGGVEYSYGFYNSKCCGNIFYPSFDCCNDNDCKSNEMSNGFCVDGKCMLKDKPSNKLFGTKKILVGYEFNYQDTCENIPLGNIDEDFSKMEQYYDHMAQNLLNKPSHYLNFKIAKAIKVPSGLNGYYGDGKTEQDILDYLSSKCGINSQEFDIVVLPKNVAQMGESAGWALSIGNGKVELYQKGYAPTLIHETGHLFGCTDLYTTMGGKLQWAKTLYGNSRTEVYDMINENRINEIPSKTFQVCRGELGWTDLNKNSIIDIEE